MTQFAWPVRVYWEDTDGGGIVYYANYLRFLERARSEWLRAKGFGQRELARDPGVFFNVIRLDIEYRRPAQLDDELRVSCEPQPEGRASLRFAQQIVRGDEVIVDANVFVACVDARTRRPTRLPAAMLAAAPELGVPSRASNRAHDRARNRA